jgi:hypothetical protein
MRMDRYPFLGRKIPVADLDAALAHVRLTWPKAGMEGSTGPERTFFVSVEGGLGLVAHCWPRKSRGEPMWLRCLSGDQSPILD